MHFQMKIQPIDNQNYEEPVNCETPATVKPMLKSRLKRLFDRQFPSVLKNNSEATNVTGDVKDAEFEPSSVCLAKMVQNFIEDAAPEKPKCGRNRCNCFNGNINDVSDDEFDLSAVGFFGDSSETLKSLTPCGSVAQRNLLADTSKIVEKNINYKRKDELKKIVADGLLLIGYDASICKSRWEKSKLYPAGTDLCYMRSKWLSAHTRSPSSPSPSLLPPPPPTPPPTPDAGAAVKQIFSGTTGEKKEPSSEFLQECGVFELIFEEDTTPSHSTETSNGVLPLRKSDDCFESPVAGMWQPPALKPRNVQRGSNLVVTGLASLFREKA
ncbi:hypothetical protein E3N88_07791 [Mikania micrantha]|uniref:Uncharacterized protein n=1 Tax=Mikania micrantha TaxID=192012 RepID=A0A5N6PGM7_9ASTR|nr:hypothetical protein E3N88_07791 [Mikania micrantha]